MFIEKKPDNFTFVSSAAKIGEKPILIHGENIKANCPETWQKKVEKSKEEQKKSVRQIS